MPLTRDRMFVSSAVSESSRRPRCHGVFIDFAGGDAEHLFHRVVGLDSQVPVVEQAEHGQTPPGEALVTVGQRMVTGDAHGQDGRLVDEVGVELVAAKGCSWSVQGGVE